MILGLDFAAQPVSDLGRAVAFYRDVLGLRLHSHTEGKWAELDLPDGNTLALYAGGGDTPFAPVTCLCLRVADVEATAKALQAEGVSFPHGTDPYDSGFCQTVQCLDSEGNTLFLHHRYQPEA